MPEVWVILVAAVIALVALALGAVIGYLVSASKAAKAAGQAETLRQDVADRETKIGDLQADVDAMRGDLHAAEKHGERTAAQLEAKEQALLEQRELLASAEAKLKDTFAGVGRDALKANTEAFLDLAKQRFETQTKQADGDLAKRQTEIEKMLAPVKVMLGEYQKRLAEIEESRTKSYSDIRQQLGQVAESHRSLGEQTTQLVNALKNPGTRGQWGELKLKRLLELAGMTEHFDFNMQVNMAGEADESAQRPDLVVDLPGERRIVVDSKYSADDFLKAADEDDLDRRTEHLRNFSKAVRRHGQQLAQKKYWERFDETPSYVVMFMPGEALLYAAVEHDAGLVEELMQKGVILATPTTLLALLKTVAMGWREAAVEANIEEVRKLGADMLDRIGTFAGHFGKVGKNLDAAVQSYNSAVASFESRLLVTAREMQKLGTESNKSLDAPKPADTATRQLPELTAGE